jgi:L-aspartate oxidase
MRPYIAAVDHAGLHRRTFDVLVLGGGIAGLTAAIGAARRWRVGLLTKSTFEETTTFLAQGGIAAALGKADSPDLHFDDTMRAGAGLCDAEPVRVLVDEGPERVRELMEICPRFDRVEGEIVLSREGAHSVPRVVHAGGDATGVVSALSRAAWSTARRP